MEPLRMALVGVALLAVSTGVMAAPASPNLVTATDPAPDATVAGSFSPTGALYTGRTMHTATALPDGRVLVIGGAGRGVDEAGPLASAELWDPSTRSFRPTGSLAHPRIWHSATLLADGRVLVTGGADGNVPAELWDPVTGSFAPSGIPSTERTGHTATLLLDGRVLVAGGYGGPGMIAQAELWDPATGEFTGTGTLQEVRSHHTATLLPDGRVLLVAGDSDLVFRDSAELWDPSTESFSLTGSLAEARWWHTATLTSDGAVLVIGGLGWADGPVALASTELWTPASGVFVPAAELAEARAWHASVPLPGGRILVVGGARMLAADGPEPAALVSAELFDPVDHEVVPAGNLSEGRTGHTATLGPDPCVLVVGGAPQPMRTEGVLTSSELWCPQD